MKRIEVIAMVMVLLMAVSADRSLLQAEADDSRVVTSEEFSKSIDDDEDDKCDELDRIMKGDTSEDKHSTPETVTVRRRKSVGATGPRAERLIKLYLNTYADHLKSMDWIKRSMAVISLGNINDSRVTEMLMDVLTSKKMDRDKNNKYVRLFAWLALLERNDSLTPDQAVEWIENGMDLALKEKVVHGKIRAALLRAIAPMGPTPPNRKLFLYFFLRTNLLAPTDIGTLDELQKLMGQWKSKETEGLIRGLIKVLNNPNVAYRAEFVLRGLKSGMKTAKDLHQTKKELAPLWSELQQQYANWLGSADLQPFEFKKRDFTVPVSGLLPGPRTLNPNDPRWRKDLELPRLRINQLCVSVVMDSTGSMSSAIDWIKRDVIRIMRALKLISREPSISVTLYRDRGEKYVVQLHKLTGSAKKLAAAIRGADAKGGGDFPEAVHAALHATLKNQVWPKYSTGRKVVVLVADAPPHQENMEKIKELVTKSAEDGFRFYCLKIHNNDFTKARDYCKNNKQEPPLNPGKAMDDIARWGKGTSNWVSFLNAESGKMFPGTWNRQTGSGMRQSAYQRLMASIFGGLINKAYRDRVDPFIRVLLECLERTPVEKRTLMPGGKDSTRHRDHGKHPKGDKQYRQ